MIRINLLPAEYIQTPQRKINPAVVVGIAQVPLIVILSLVYLPKVSQNKSLKRDVEDLNSKLERYKPIIAQVESLEQAKAQLQQQSNVIQSLESERLRYPIFMDDFLKLLPSNIWLTNLNTAIQSADGMALNMDVVALDNYAIADFISNLETSGIFTDVELGAISFSQGVTGTAILNFHLTTNYKKGGNAANAAKKP